MELDDHELALLAKSVGITVDSLDRKVQRIPEGLRIQAEIELDQNETLLRRIRDEQRMRRQASA